MFLRSMFAFQFLPPRQAANLLSEAIPKASPEDINSPSPSRSAAGSASLETFPGAAPEVRESIHPATPGDPPATHPRVDTGPQPGSNLSQMSAPSPRASSLWIWLEPAGLLSAGSWDLATLFFFRRSGFVHVGASVAVPVGKKIRGWTAACCGRWYRHSLGKRWLGAQEPRCNSCLPTTFILQRALNDGAEIVQ